MGDGGRGVSDMKRRYCERFLKQQEVTYCSLTFLLLLLLLVYHHHHHHHHNSVKREHADIMHFFITRLIIESRQTDHPL